jgi:large subunit ribosomal protein L31
VKPRLIPAAPSGILPGRFNERVGLARGIVPCRRRLEETMRAGIHPVYEVRTFHCYGCNTEWETRTTLAPSTSDGKVHLDICSNCHPFFTGKQKLIDKAGRVDRFRRRYAKKDAPTEDAGAGTSTTANQ